MAQARKLRLSNGLVNGMFFILAANCLDEADCLLPNLFGLVPKQCVGARAVGMTEEVDWFDVQSLCNGHLYAQIRAPLSCLPSGNSHVRDA